VELALLEEKSHRLVDASRGSTQVALQKKLSKSKCFSAHYVPELQSNHYIHSVP